MSEELGREFGWDDVIQNDGQEFEPIPEGDYDFVIDKFERSRSSRKCKTSAVQHGSRIFPHQRIRDREVTIRAELYPAQQAENGNFPNCSVQPV